MAGQKVDGSRVLRIVLLHLLFWVFIVTYFAWGFGFNIDPIKSFSNALFYLPGHMLMVYSLIYLLVPRYLLQKKFLKFFLGLLLVVLVCAFYANSAQLIVNKSMGDFRGFTLSIGRNILPFLHVGGIALSIKLLQHWYFQKQQTIDAERQKTIAELNLLKAQLHPHFLFNTLNNLYASTLEKSANAPEIVLKLSHLLRFMIYESNVPRISLEKEISLLKDYIALEQLRYGDRLDLSISIDGPVEDYQIAPLLLLPFLENAFKHGTSKQIDQCWISMSLSLEGAEMHFKLINSRDPNSREEEDASGGLGLKNVMRRLELLYPRNYQFSTEAQSEVYIVDLTLTLEELEENPMNNLKN